MTVDLLNALKTLLGWMKHRLILEYNVVNLHQTKTKPLSDQQKHKN